MFSEVKSTPAVALPRRFQYRVRDLMIQEQSGETDNRVPKMVVFTDLDGSLLDPLTYSFDAASEALSLIRTSGIPLILASSKTRAEIEPIRFRLNHLHPFIVENGGGLYIPKGLFDFPVEETTLRGPYQVIEIGMPYTRLRAALKEIEQRIGSPLRGFGDMSAEEVAERTGLSQPDALLAKQREYDEPFVIEGPSRVTEEIQREIDARGLRCTRGGRFYHLMGRNDKGRACKLLIDCYRRQYRSQGDGLVLVAIGDSLNDLPMLAAVDRPVLVQKPDGSFDPEVQLPNLIRAQGIGPAGWNRAVLDILRTS